MLNEEAIISLIKDDQWMMEVLQAARSLNLPDWWICAGFVRSKMILLEYYFFAIC